MKVHRGRIIGKEKDLKDKIQSICLDYSTDCCTKIRFHIHKEIHNSLGGIEEYGIFVLPAILHHKIDLPLSSNEGSSLIWLKKFHRYATEMKLKSVPSMGVVQWFYTLCYRIGMSFREWPEVCFILKLFRTKTALRRYRSHRTLSKGARASLGHSGLEPRLPIYISGVVPGALQRAKGQCGGRIGAVVWASKCCLFSEFAVVGDLEITREKPSRIQENRVSDLLALVADGNRNLLALKFDADACETVIHGGNTRLCLDRLLREGKLEAGDVCLSQK
ncbi:hypothetical protein Tco_0954991 [Tanacetum coccineum]|uniref:Uncharacterized protein n=1 Tax=Tanacetum coccineum TaxID=301880 RepID=A0ABQ5E5Y7_9ASTR